MRAREIVLLVVLVLAGIAVYAWKTGEWTFGWEDGGGPWGHSYAFEERLAVEGPLPARLDVLDNRGAVDIRVGPPGAVTVACEKRIRRRNESQARDVAERLKVFARKEADRVAVGTNRSDFRKTNFETDLTITVPPGTEVRVDNRYGAVTVAGTARTTVFNRHGRVYCGEISGPLEVETSYDEVRVDKAGAGARIANSHDTVDVTGVTGDLTVTGRYGEIRVDGVSGRAAVDAPNSAITCRRVQGPVEVSNSYDDVVLEDVGPATVRSRHSDVRASAVRGALDVSDIHGLVRAEGVDGGLKVDGENVEIRADGVRGDAIELVTSYESVDLGGFTGRAVLRVRHGDVVLRPERFGGPIDVRNEYSAVRLVWPKGSETPFQAEARNGRIEWRLAASPSLNTSNGTSLLKAFPGAADRPAVSIVTSYGDVTVEDGETKGETGKTE